MMEYIGVHVAEDRLYISRPEAGEVLVEASPFLTGWKKERILTEEGAFSDAFSRIRRYVRERCGVEDFELLLAVPDGFGLKEMLRLRGMAETAGIRICRFLPESMAAALTLMVTAGVEGNVLIAVPGEESLSVTEYELISGVAERGPVYISGSWTTWSPEGFTFLSDGAKQAFEISEAGAVFVAGTLRETELLQENLRMYRPGGATEMKYRRNRRVEAMAPTAIAYGLGLQSAKLCGYPGMRDYLALDTYSPYELCVSVNGEMYEGFPANEYIPIKQEILCETVSDVSKGAELVLYEKRGIHYDKVCSLAAEASELEVLGTGTGSIVLSIGVDANRRMELGLSSVRSRETAVLSLEDLWLAEEKKRRAEAGKKRPAGDTGTVTGEESPSKNAENAGAEDRERQADEGTAGSELPEGIELPDFLTVVDSLEYAIRYAQDPADPRIQGIQKIYQQALTILEKRGVEQIPAEGQLFDYRIHNAVAQVPDVDLPSGTVKEVMQTGYRYKDGAVIRYASVIVVD